MVSLWEWKYSVPLDNCFCGNSAVSLLPNTDIPCDENFNSIRNPNTWKINKVAGFYPTFDRGYYSCGKRFWLSFHSRHLIFGGFHTNCLISLLVWTCSLIGFFLFTNYFTLNLQERIEHIFTLQKLELESLLPCKACKPWPLLPTHTSFISWTYDVLNSLHISLLLTAHVYIFYSPHIHPLLTSHTPFTHCRIH